MSRRQQPLNQSDPLVSQLPWDPCFIAALLPEADGCDYVVYVDLVLEGLGVLAEGLREVGVQGVQVHSLALLLGEFHVVGFDGCIDVIARDELWFQEKEGEGRNVGLALARLVLARSVGLFMVGIYMYIYGRSPHLISICVHNVKRHLSNIRVDLGRLVLEEFVDAVVLSGGIGPDELFVETAGVGTGHALRE